MNIQFTHSSIQEYLAAEALYEDYCQSLDKTQFLGTFDDLMRGSPLWRSLIPDFFFGLLKTGDSVEPAHFPEDGRAPIVGLNFADVSDVFKGRVDEMEQLRRLLSDPKAKLICIVGRGGIGKTALLSKLCDEIERGQLRLSKRATTIGCDGIIYVSCRGTDTPTVERLFHDFGQVLGTPHSKALINCWRDASRAIADRVRFLLSQLQNGCYLLVLDNFEDVLAPDNTIADEDLRDFVNVCLETSHGLRLIVTSREEVMVGEGGEDVVRLVPLNSGLAHADALALLRDLDPHGRLGLRGGSDDALHKVVVPTFGHPRALRLVARILSKDKFLTVETLVANEDLMKNLEMEGHCRMTDKEHKVIGALAVYNRPVPTEAVCNLLKPFYPHEDVVDCLHSLVDNLFVTYRREHDTYELHNLDQEYAYRQIPDTGKNYTRLALHHRAAAYYRQTRRPENEWKTLQDLEPQLQEYEHLYRAEEYEEAYRLLNTCLDYLNSWQNHLTQWGYMTMTEMYTRLLEHITDPKRVADIRFGIASSHYDNPSKCLTCCEEAIAIAIEAGNEHTKAKALRLMTWIYHEENSYLNDLGYLEEALRIFHTQGDWSEEMNTLCDLARAYFEHGEFEKAKSFAEQGLAGELLSYQTLGHQTLGRLHHTLGRIYAADEEWNEALIHYYEALKRFEDWSVGGEAAVKRRIGVVLVEQKKYKEALDYFQSALSLCHKSKIPLGIALVLYEMGRCYFKMGPVHTKDALATLLTTKQIHEETGITHPDAPVDQFLNEIRASIGAEEYGRLIGEIDLSQSEYFDSSSYGNKHSLAGGIVSGSMVGDP